jgi:hypothetical protein
MASAYMVMGHGHEKPGRTTVPDGCTLVLTEECGMLGTIPFRVLETMSAHAELWADPTTNKLDIEKLLGRRIRIYKAGQAAPRLFVSLLSDHSARKGVFQPSGVHRLPLDLDAITMNPVGRGDARYETKNAALSFRGATLGSMDDATTWYSQEELFKKLPGVHYNFLCREIRLSSNYSGDAVSLEYILDAVRAAFPSLRLKEQGDPIRTVDAWIASQDHSTFTALQHEVADTVHAEARRLVARRKSSGSPLSARDTDLLIELLVLSPVVPRAAMDLIGRLEEVNRGSRHYGLTPLMAAARYGHVEAMDALLSVGAHIEVTDDEGATALMYACLGDSHTAVQMLVARGANIHARDIHGCTPLFRAASNAEMVHVLLAAGADVNAVDSEGDGPLMMAIGHPGAPIRELLAAGADVNQAGRNGETPLFQAIKDKDEAVAHLLLDTGRVDIGVRTKSGRGLVGAAANQGMESLTLRLLKAGAPVKDIESLKTLAKKNGMASVVELLTGAAKE